ncbi:STM4014 family protein [Luteolibacter soli]|uniref:STM4014 family protein n=1 Tax=Luteolibacter soli TaxID=3135280 RepID=A0ABU9B0S0_9BACT
MTRFALLGQPGTRRTAGFLAACASRGLPEPRVIPWEEALAPDFDPAARLSGVDALRIETPADCPAAERVLLTRGHDTRQAESHHPTLAPEDCAALPDDDGQLRHQRQWYLGFRAVLDDIDAWCRRTGVRPMNAPGEIAVLFDKLATREVLEAADVSMPPSGGLCHGFDHLVAIMDRGHDRVFLKPCHGSSASGVMAIARNKRGDWRAVTTAQPDGNVIRNLKRPREIRQLDELRSTVDAVGRQRALVERWFPKATLGGRAFDLRVVVVAGMAAHVVVRTSRGPITNLHLDNRRGDLKATWQAVGEPAWRRGLQLAESAALCFPGCHYVGVDVMIGVRGQGEVIAEINAFGDLLHHERWRGKNPWELEVDLWRW